MAELSTLNATTRSEIGSRACRKLRQQGQIPGNVYGHKKGAVAISIDGQELTRAVYSGHKIVDVTLDGELEKTIIREVQWNTFATEILHFDLVRIDANERILVSVPVELKGISPGVTSGGVLDQQVHEVEMEVLAFDLIDSLVVRISDLQIGDSHTLADVELPKSAQIELPLDTVLVQVNEPIVITDEDEEQEEGGPTEPELIGKSEDEDDS